MNINLDDKKIVKVVYRADDSRIIEFNYNDGNLVSVNTNEFCNKCECEKKVMSDSEMIDAVKKSSFMDKLQDAKEKSKSLKNKPVLDEDKNEEKDMSTAQEAIRKIIKMDQEGVLDEIAKRSGVVNKCVLNLPNPEDEERDMDKKKCKQSIATLNHEIFKLINNLPVEELKDNKDFFDKIENYKYYVVKMDELTDNAFSAMYRC